MKEYAFPELGYFAARECQAIKDTMEGKTFMRFHVSWSNIAGNCTLVIATDHDSTEEEIKNFFLSCVLSSIFRLRREATEK